MNNIYLKLPVLYKSENIFDDDKKKLIFFKRKWNWIFMQQFAIPYPRWRRMNDYWRRNFTKISETRKKKYNNFHLGFKKFVKEKGAYLCLSILRDGNLNPLQLLFLLYDYYYYLFRHFISNRSISKRRSHIKYSRNKF